MQASVITLISNAFTQGGIWMYAIGVVQCFSLAIIIERVYSLYLRKIRSQKKVIKEFEKNIKSGQLSHALIQAKSYQQSEPIANVIAVGLEAAQEQGGREEIQSRMDEILTVENARLEKRTGFLAMLANVGTLMGLLGTIIGLIKAFSSAAGLGAVEKSVALTQGVSLAMNTTAYGLIMAIPALIMYAVLTNRSNQLKDDLNQSAFKVFNWISFNYENVQKKTIRPSAR